MNPNGPVIAQRHQHLLPPKQVHPAPNPDPNVVISQRHRFHTLQAPVRVVQPPQPQPQPRHYSPPPRPRHPISIRRPNNQTLPPPQPPPQPVVNLGHSVRKLSGTSQIQQPPQPSGPIGHTAKNIENLRKSFGDNTPVIVEEKKEEEKN